MFSIARSLNRARERVNPTATNKARGTFDATRIFCVSDEVSTVSQGDFLVLWVFPAEALLTRRRFKKKKNVFMSDQIFASHIFICSL